MATSIVEGRPPRWALVRRHAGEACFGVQVCGGYPDLMARCGELLDETTSCDFVDINMGCPIDGVCAAGGGVGRVLGTQPFERRRPHVAHARSGARCTIKIRMGYAAATRPRRRRARRRRRRRGWRGGGGRRRRGRRGASRAARAHRASYTRISVGGGSTDDQSVRNHRVASSVGLMSKSASLLATSGNRRARRSARTRQSAAGIARKVPWASSRVHDAARVGHLRGGAFGVPGASPVTGTDTGAPTRRASRRRGGSCSSG